MCLSMCLPIDHSGRECSRRALHATTDHSTIFTGHSAFFLRALGAMPLSEYNIFVWCSQVSTGALSVRKTKDPPVGIHLCPCNNKCSQSLIYADAFYAFRCFVLVDQSIYACRVWEGRQNGWVVQELFWEGMFFFLARNRGFAFFFWQKIGWGFLGKKRGGGAVRQYKNAHNQHNPLPI